MPSPHPLKGRVMKVKLFWTYSNLPIGKGSSTAEKYGSLFENELNTWLTENPRIKVVNIQQSASGGSGGGMVMWLISVWYEEGV